MTGNSPSGGTWSNKKDKATNSDKKDSRKEPKPIQFANVSYHSPDLGSCPHQNYPDVQTHGNCSHPVLQHLNLTNPHNLTQNIKFDEVVSSNTMQYRTLLRVWEIGSLTRTYYNTCTVYDKRSIESLYGTFRLRTGKRTNHRSLEIYM